MSLSLGISLGINAPQAQGAPFDPADLFGPGDNGWLWQGGDPSRGFLFQDAGGTTPCTAAGDPIGLIQDESGNGEDFSQATAAAQPTLQEPSADVWVARSDGVDDFLELDPFIGLVGGATIICAVNGPPQVNQTLWGEGSTVDADPVVLINSGPSAGVNDHLLQYIIRRDAGTIAVAQLGNLTVLDNNWHILSWVDEGNRLRTYVDGQAEIDVAYTLGTVTLDRGGFFATPQAALASFFECDLGIYSVGINRVLSTGERQQMEQVVASYVGVTL